MQEARAREIDWVLLKRASIDEWVSSASKGDGTPQFIDDEVRDEVRLPGSEDEVVLRHLRSAYIADLVARFGSDPVVRKLAVVNHVLTTEGSG